jgi:N-acetylglucosaminyldiphosphoundecaprenol N-acetyl-beta-D-mannosaminyltransferase
VQTSSSEGRRTIEFLGLEFDALSISDATDRLEGYIRNRRIARIACVNVALLVWARSSANLREIYRKCDLLLADGMGIYYGSRVLGRPTPGITNAILLMDELVKRAAASGHRVYLLGTKSDILEVTVSRLRERFPALSIVGQRDGFFSIQDEPVVVRAIASARPDILLIGISSVRKDEFLDRQLARLGVPVCLGVGGAFDVIAGVHKLAPEGVRRAGLEWLYRLVQEPRRLWKRYLSTNSIFCLLLIHAAILRFVPARSRQTGSRRGQ